MVKSVLWQVDIISYNIYQKYCFIQAKEAMQHILLIQSQV